MKYFFFCLAAAALLASCSKHVDDLISPPPATTDLEINVSSNNTAVTGATVTLYGSENDFLTKSHSVYSTLTNSSGIALFKNLQSKKYWFWVQKDCQDNTAGNTNTFTGLTSGIKNITSTTLTGMGTLKFVNNSTNPYKIYLNGVLAIGSMPGGTSTTLHMPSRFYTVRVVQLSGYIFTPTDITYSGTLACGGMLTTAFP